MPSIARGQENTADVLNWFIAVSGILTDAYSVEYQIFDISGGLPGTQIWPEVVDDWEDVSAAPGKFSTGSYYAYDNTNEQGWTPELDASVGLHRIYWRWKITVGSDYQTSSEDFNVLLQSEGSSADTYITVQDVRDAGLTDETTFPDATVLSMIEVFQATIDRACRQWFKPKYLLLQVDGTDSDTLHFGVPIISIDYIKLNNDTSELDTDLYKVYSGRTYPDDRKNPRIKLVGTQEYRDIYTSPIRIGRLLFDKGRQNQEIKGYFGFVEDDMSTPKPIQRALLKLVIQKLTNPIYVSDPAAAPVTPPPILGSILEEETDFHSRKYAQVGAEIKKKSPYLTGITDDQEIIEIIKMYKAPIGCATPAHPSYR